MAAVSWSGSAANSDRGSIRIDASYARYQQLLVWAQQWPERSWAVENAEGLWQCGGGRSAGTAVCAGRMAETVASPSIASSHLIVKFRSAG
ncbi:hypothetical protein [Nocardia amamiensis]|uniref:hypothetical protein n=1 Tax=Nocardia amamiensis TaxID=404578 RepID=UPI000836CEB2|nr:hypothetical protein [Nocardia amamiensis]